MSAGKSDMRELIMWQRVCVMLGVYNWGTAVQDWADGFGHSDQGKDFPGGGRADCEVMLC